jgi:beta-galactosidase GanA
MKIRTILPILAATTGLLAGTALADEIQFTTLPQPVQTTVIRETHIQGPTAVERVIQSQDGVYAVTVREDSGEHIVYVNSTGAIVQAPATSTTTTTVQPQVGTQETVVTQEDVQTNQSRYELLEKKGNKEVYLDHQTGQKVIVKRKGD